jgi:hypothetical protein
MSIKQKFENIDMFDIMFRVSNVVADIKSGAIDPHATVALGLTAENMLSIGDFDCSPECIHELTDVEIGKEVRDIMSLYDLSHIERRKMLELSCEVTIDLVQFATSNVVLNNRSANTNYSYDQDLLDSILFHRNPYVDYASEENLVVA